MLCGGVVTSLDGIVRFPLDKSLRAIYSTQQGDTMKDLYLLTSSMGRIDETDHQIVAVGPYDELIELSQHFGVRSWTLDNGVRLANDGRIKLQKVRTWGVE